MLFIVTIVGGNLEIYAYYMMKCEMWDMILLTANRRMKSEDSLEQVMREENTQSAASIDWLRLHCMLRTIWGQDEFSSHEALVSWVK